MHVGKLNTRNELHGKDKVPAVDIPISFRGTKRDIDRFIPVQDGKFSDIAYEGGAFLFPYLSPLKVHRKPEGLDIRMYGIDLKKPYLSFSGGKLKNIEITFNNRHEIQVTGTLQVEIDAERDAARLIKMMDTDCDIEFEATQEEMFGAAEDEEEEEEEPGDQPQLLMQ